MQYCDSSWFGKLQNYMSDPMLYPMLYLSYQTTLTGKSKKELDAAAEKWASGIVSTANAIIAPGYKSYRDRDAAYDDKTKHGGIKKSEVTPW